MVAHLFQIYQWKNVLPASPGSTQLSMHKIGLFKTPQLNSGKNWLDVHIKFNCPQNWLSQKNDSMQNYRLEFGKIDSVCATFLSLYYSFIHVVLSRLSRFFNNYSPSRLCKQSSGTLHKLGHLWRCTQHIFQSTILEQIVYMYGDDSKYSVVNTT